MKKNYTFIFAILYLQFFSQVASYNFTSGSGADVSGNGNHGTLFGSTANVDSLL